MDAKQCVVDEDSRLEEKSQKKDATADSNGVVQSSVIPVLKSKINTPATERTLDHDKNFHVYILCLYLSHFKGLTKLHCRSPFYRIPRNKASFTCIGKLCYHITTKLLLPFFLLDGLSLPNDKHIQITSMTSNTLSCLSNQLRTNCSHEELS
jgi:hypothetical protein